MVDEQTGASSAPAAVTALDLAVSDGDVASFREARAAERSGKPLDATADPSPALKPDAVADSSPAAEKPRTDRRATEHRVPELLTERAQLRTRLGQQERELAALRQSPKPDVSSTASSAVADAELPEYDAWTEIAGNETKTYTQYQVWLTRQVYAQEQQAIQQRDAVTAAERQQVERVQKYRASADTFVADHADYWDTVRPVTETDLSKGIKDALEDAIDQSANGPALLYHLGSHPEIFQRLITLPERLAAWELGKLEASLASASTPKPRLTRAPEPVTTLGRKAADPADPIDAAVADDDVGRYRAARLEQRRAAQR